MSPLASAPSGKFRPHPAAGFALPGCSNEDVCPNGRSMLLLLLVGAGGTYILRRERNSPLLVGFVVGVAGMMANLQVDP
eukprot:scaffold904_cov239-Pinguiococcus_pyrenoidosus.AAC.12